MRRCSGKSPPSPEGGRVKSAASSFGSPLRKVCRSGLRTTVTGKGASWPGRALGSAATRLARRTERSMAISITPGASLQGSCRPPAESDDSPRFGPPSCSPCRAPGPPRVAWGNRDAVGSPTVHPGSRPTVVARLPLPMGPDLDWTRLTEKDLDAGNLGGRVVESKGGTDWMKLEAGRHRLKKSSGTASPGTGGDPPQSLGSREGASGRERPRGEPDGRRRAPRRGPSMESGAFAGRSGEGPRAEVRTGGRVALRPERSPDPCTLVLFGASGDLAHRKVVPALYEL